MKKLTNKKLRALVKQNINNINKMSKKSFQKTIKVSDIDAIIAFINEKQKDGEKINSNFFNNALTLANLSTLCIAMISLSLYSSESDEEIFPKNWLSEAEIPNPNFILSNLLLQITNYSIAILDLLEKGLDNPARALVRSISELCNQTIILIDSQNDFKEYIKGNDENASNGIWYRLFSKNKMFAKISAIEKKIGHDDEFTNFYYTYRKERHQYFSESVHHSYIAVNLGAYAYKCENNDENVKNLFGGENAAIDPPLYYLNTTLFMFIMFFYKIVNKPKNPDKEFWLESFALYQSIEPAYLDIYYSEEGYKA